MDIKRLKAKMIIFGDTGENLAEYLNISRTTLSAKMSPNNASDFTRKEIQKIKERYHMTAEEVDNIFFNFKVSFSDTK